MQTLLPFPRVRRRLAAWAAILCAVALCAACTAPRVSGKAEAERDANACESAFADAGEHSEAVTDVSLLLVERYQAARSAQHDWLDVAIQCPQRFSEGVLHSAQAQHYAATLASALGRDYQPLTVNRLDTVTALPIGNQALARLALAEDRAGFATQTLAGRYVAGMGSDAATAALADDGTLLDMSDDHKETASRLMSLTDSGQEDLRQKVYAAVTLIDDPDTAVDPTTGLRDNTLSIVEMDCAREELQDMEQYASLDHAADTEDAQRQLRASLLQLAMLIATHAYTAFDLGYPLTDSVLFGTQ